MATTLYGWDWVGDDEPDTGVLATQGWIKPTTGEKYRRNTSNTAWVFDGNVNSRVGGAVEVAGSTVTGPILDIPNLASLTDPDFIGTIRQDGMSVALTTALASLEKRTFDRLASLVREQYLSSNKVSGAGAAIAFDSQTFLMSGQAAIATGLTVPLPTFVSDGAVATAAQVRGYGCSIAGFAYHDDALTTNLGTWVMTETGASTRVFRLQHTVSGTDWADVLNATWAFSTFILATR